MIPTVILLHIINGLWGTIGVPLQELFSKELPLWAIAATWAGTF